MDLLSLLGVAVLLLAVALLWSRVAKLEEEVRQFRRERRPAGSPERVPIEVSPWGKAAPRRKAAVESDTASVEESGEIEVEVVEQPVAVAPAGPDVPRETPEPAPVAVAAGSRVDDDSESDGFSFEEILAGKWLTWVGAVAVVLGAGFFFKYAIDAGWIGPAERVAIGLFVGVAAYVGAVVAVRRDYGWLGQGLAGAAAGILYFDLYAALHFYELVSTAVALTGMSAVTLATLAFAHTSRGEATAVLGLLGGFLTPLLLTTGFDRPAPFFLYLLVLDLGVFALAVLHRWRVLQNTAFVGTLLMWLVWLGRFYEASMFGGTLVLLSVFFLLFVAVGLWQTLFRREKSETSDAFLLVANPVVTLALGLGLTAAEHDAWHGTMAAVFALFYAAVGTLLHVKHREDRLAVTLSIGLGVVFLVLAVPLQLTGHWVVVCWALLAAALIETGLRADLTRLRLAGFGLLGLVGFVLLQYVLRGLQEPELLHTLVVRRALDTDWSAWPGIVNGRSFAFLCTAVGLGFLSWEYGRLPNDPETDQAPGDPVVASGTLRSASVVLLAVMCVLESVSYAGVSDWFGMTTVAAVSCWVTLAAVVLAALGRWTGPVWVQQVGVVVFGLAGLLLGVLGFGTLTGWEHEWQWLQSQGDVGTWATFLCNPRGGAFAWAVVGAGVAARLSTDSKRTEQADDVSPATVFVVAAYLLGLAMLTTEVFAYGVVHDWKTWTSLAITGTWTVYAVVTLVVGVAGRFHRVRVAALGLFVVTTVKVFLHDVWFLDPAIRTLAFTGLGAALLGVSWTYRRHRDRIRNWIGGDSNATAA